CYKAFREVLPQEAYFLSHRSESERQEKICREFNAMQSCFTTDECGGERCSLPLRLTVAKGLLIDRIQKHEEDAAPPCAAQRERERIANLEAERARQRREEELRVERRRNQTFQLTICNHATKGIIWVAIAYIDYDVSNWIVEGWWSLPQGQCTYIGDRFTRGN